MMRDAEFGMIRLRAFGAYSFRVADPEVFLREVFGTSSEYTVQDVEGQLKRTLVSGLSDAIAESKLPALDLAANYDEIGDYALKTINPRIEKLGLTLASSSSRTSPCRKKSKRRWISARPWACWAT